MVDFRKWLFALAPIGLLLGIGSAAANAQTSNSTFTCTASAGVPNILRSEGVTELVGDLTLNCTGGNPTPAGAPIPLQNFQISLNTNVTSRVISATSGLSEALLMIDEPYPSGAQGGPNPPTPTSQPPTGSNAQSQEACQALNSTNCMITSNNGLGTAGTTGPYNGVPDGYGNHYNIFQGYQTGVNTVAWNGVPVDAPGTSGTRVIRVTNIRANAFQLGVSSTLIPTQISMIVAVSGSQFISILQPSNGNVVGQIQPGLVGSNSTASYTQCSSVNTYLIAGTTSPVTTDSGIAVSAKEGFAASFKPQSYAQFYNVNYAVSKGYLAPAAPGQYYTSGEQNIPGFSYNTESGFFSPTATGLVNPSSGAVGLADTGTEIQFSVAGVGAGVSMYAPEYVYLNGAYGAGVPVGVAVLMSATGAPAASSIPLAYSSGVYGTNCSNPGPYSGGNPCATPATQTPTAATLSGTGTTLVYQIYYADPSVQETLSVPVSVAYVSNTANNLPGLTTAATGATVGVNFYPLSTSSTATSGPIPRFGQPYPTASLFTINACTCNLLFPFVTNIAGFDTGIAIANTSQDPFGTSPQTGTIALNYYGTTSGGGAAPPKATTTSNIPGGSELVFTLSSGGNYGIAATPGFEGYIIASANFQYCHGFAFISDVGAQKLAEGYLAISLDLPVVTVLPGNLPTGLNRTHNAGENEGH